MNQPKTCSAAAYSRTKSAARLAARHSIPADGHGGRHLAFTDVALLVSVTLQMAADRRARLDTGLQAPAAVLAPDKQTEQLDVESEDESPLRVDSNKIIGSSSHTAHARGLSHA